MKNLDSILKTAKPAVPDLPLDFSARVMTEIETIDLATTSTVPSYLPVKWKQLAGGVFLLTLALVIVNNIIFEVQMNGSLEMLYFGTRFLKDVFSYIPFDLIIPAIIVTGFSSWLMWNSKAIKRGIAGIVIGSFLTATFGGAALASTGINKQIQTAVIKEKDEWPIVSWFFKERARYFIDHPNFRMGRVEQSDGKYVWIVNPQGKKFKIELPSDMMVNEGQIISVTGIESDNLFKVANGRHCDPGRVGRYFHSRSMMHQGREGKMKNHHRMMDGEGMMMK